MFAHVHNTGSAYFAHTTGWKQILDTTLAASIYAPLASPTFTGTVNFSNATVTGLSTLPIQINNTGKYLKTDGYQATWETITLPQYSIIASPTFSGTVDFSGSTVVGITTTVADSSITSAKILDGTIVNGDINASASISPSKISGTAVTLSDTATVTNTMLAGSIANSKLANSYISINGTSVSLGGSTTIATLPSQSGASGKYLTSDGSSASWGTISTSSYSNGMTTVANKIFYNNTGSIPAGTAAGDLYIQY